MKIIKYLFCTVIIGLTVASCNDLELEPKGIIDENTLLRSDNGVMKYLAGIYNDLPIEDFNYKATGDGRGYTHHDGQFWEAQKGSPATAACEGTGRGETNGDGFGYWPYGRIRDINLFIEALPRYKGNYTEDEYNALLGEGRFLRAFYYFGLVKRYGGVPIVDKVQDPTANIDSLRLPRSTEYDCWKFIHNDLKFAMENASTKRANTSRANRYVAAALMSRAMLYAACNAKYGSYSGITGPATDRGLMGMAPDHAEEFFQYAYDACKFLHDAGFKLHTGADKVAAYVEVFLGDNNQDEDIFVKKYGPNATTPFNMNLYHSWDSMVLPLGTGLSSSVGCALQPVWECMGLFQMPAIVDGDGNPVRFNSLSDIWNNNEMEARCKADFFFPGMTDPVSGTVFDIQAGVYKSYPGSAADGTPEASESDFTNKYRVRARGASVTQTINEKQVKVNGKFGLDEGAGDEGKIYTGAVIRKYIGNTADRGAELYKSSQPWKVFRYGEILCNWAEAAYELGLIRNDESLKKEAVDHVNELRNRAGARPYSYQQSPIDIGFEKYGFSVDENLQFIRDERERELCFENQLYWDQRRWRISDVIFQNYWPHSLLGYYVADENKYIFLKEVTFFGRRLTFEKRWYYEQIPGGEINKNPLLVRNDGY